MSEQTINQTMRNPPISFWDFLKEYKVVIPIIQRDYAQGRTDRHQLRKEFFGQLISSLKNSIPCKLDFVYACPRNDYNHVYSDENKIIYPLDGQQRLTSLWLLHWYIAYKAGLLVEGNPYYDIEAAYRLKRFSYETRTSSREFCERLCGNLVGTQQGSIKKHIAGQPWFTSKYKEDPTVTAMLRSLSDPDNQSGFEQLLSGDDTDFKALWDSLCSESCPLKFHFRNTENEGILNSDDLYIKMNARGKKLTDFENFKAELFSFRPDGRQELFRGEDDDFIRNFDNAWTNYFWPLRSKDNVVDYLILEFFNRQALNFLILKGDLENQKTLYDYLTRHLPFSNIEVYSPILTEEFKSFYSNVWKGITMSHVRANECFREPYKFDFIPVYAPEKKGYEVKYRDSVYYVSPSTVRTQVLTHAASIYFANLYINDKSFNSLYFDDWMLFARNLMDNSGVDTYADIRSLLEFLSSLNDKSSSIVSNLTTLNYGTANLPTKAKEQLLEEIQKADRINHLRENSEQSEIDNIRHAEKTYPFDGAVRYLFRNAIGEADWTNFNLKKHHFDEFLAIGHENEKGDVSAHVLRCLYKQINRWDDMDRPWLNSSYSAWKEILTNDNLRYAVDSMLIDGVQTDEDLSGFNSPFTDPIQKGTHEELVRSKFLHQTTWGDFYFKAWEHRAVIWRCSVDWKNYLLGTSRNRLICEGVDRHDIFFPEGIESCRMLGDRAHLWGESFYFDVRGNETPYIFYWYDSEVRRRNRSDELTHDVYLVLRNSDRHEYAASDPNDLGITVEYQCSYNDFLGRLFSLLDKAESD